FLLYALVVFFFFQAEDGIRVDLVTGVQTCALPISSRAARALMRLDGQDDRQPRGPRSPSLISARAARDGHAAGHGRAGHDRAPRSEERRVGKEGRARGDAENRKIVRVETEADKHAT